MGVISVMYLFGFKYEMMLGKYDMEGVVNLLEVVVGFEFYKEFYKILMFLGYMDSYMEQLFDVFKFGQVVMVMNWFVFFLGFYVDLDIGGDKIGFFVNLGQVKEVLILGGQGIFVVVYFDKQDVVFEYIKWFVQLFVQSKWWVFGGYFCYVSVLNDLNFVDSVLFVFDFLFVMDGVMDFWQEFVYVELLFVM